MTKAAPVLKRAGDVTELWRVIAYATSKFDTPTIRFQNILRTNLGLVRGKPHCRERIAVDIALDLVSVGNMPDGRTVIRLACPDNVPNMAIVGKTPNVVSATCRDGVLDVVIEKGADMYFELDFTALMTQPIDSVMRGRIEVGMDAARPGSPAVAPKCNIDYSAITADISTGSPS